MKRLLIAPSWSQQAKRNKPQRFKQPPTSWWNALRGYLKRLKRAARPSSVNCQTAVRPPPHQSAPIKTFHQRICSKQQLWQRLKGPSTDSNPNLNSSITSSFAQPSVNFSLRLFPATPVGSHSFAHRGLTTLPINHPNPKIGQISSRTPGVNSLFGSLKPLPMMIPTGAIVCSVKTLSENQHHQKTAALVYLPKQINHLPPLPPIIVVNKPPQPLNPAWQWLANKPQVIDPAVKITNPSPKEPTVQETESEKSTQKKLQNKILKRIVVFDISKNESQESQESRKRCHPYFDFDFDVKLAEPPKKRARLAFDPDKISLSLVESENKVPYPFFEMTNSSPRGSTVKKTEPEKPIQKKSKSTVFKPKYSPKLSMQFSELKKCRNPYFGSDLEELPTKPDKLASNLNLNKTRASLIKSENKVPYPFVEMTNPSPEGQTVTKTLSEKPTQKNSQNTTCKRRLFFYKLKKLQELPTSQQSRKRCHSDSGSELVEPPTKRTKLASNLTPDKTSLSLIESENKGIYQFVEIINSSLKKSTVTAIEPEKSTQKKLQGNRFKEAVFLRLQKAKIRNQENAVTSILI